MKVRAALIAGAKPGGCAAHARRPELPDDFQERVFKDSVKEGVAGVRSAHAQLSHWLMVR